MFTLHRSVANKFTLDVAPGLEAPGGLGGLCGIRSRRGGTGGKDVWGGIDIGDGGLSTCTIQTITNRLNFENNTSYEMRHYILHYKTFAG